MGYRYTVQVALTEHNGPESEFLTDCVTDAVLLYRALRDAKLRPVRLIVNGYYTRGSNWIAPQYMSTIENGIETGGALRPVS